MCIHKDLDFIRFDADAFMFDVIINGDCDNVAELLKNVNPSEENYQSIKDTLLYSGDVIEYVDLLVSKYGIKKIKKDRELYNKLCKTFEKDLLDIIMKDESR